MKVWKIMVLAAVLAVVSVSLVRHVVMRNVVQAFLAEGLGAEVDVHQTSVDLWRSTVSLTGIRLRNPDGFPGDTAVEIERLQATYRLSSLFSRAVRLSDVVLDVNRVVLVTNEEGHTNLDQIARRSGLRDRPREDTMPVPGDARIEDEGTVGVRPGQEQVREERSVHIEHLTFRLGNVEMRDYSRGTPQPRVRHYRLNLERTFSDVDDVASIAQAVSMDLAMAMGPQFFRDVLEDSGVTAEELVETITTHEGDLDELGRKLDEQTKDVQRELRRQLRSLREQAPE